MSYLPFYRFKHIALDAYLYMLKKPKRSILITPLDWGLGHAARCIPIIKSFQEKGIEVHIACSKNQIGFFEKECPSSTVVEFPSATVRYPKNKFFFLASVFIQMLAAVPIEKKARRQMAHYIIKKNISLLISDSRPLILSACKQSVYISHQLHPQPTYAGFFISAWQQFASRKSLSVWVPDFKNQEKCLAGHLSHPVWNDRCRYIGMLSRFSGNNWIKVSKNRILILLSGPEPSRTILEQKLLSILSVANIPFFLVRGTQKAAPLQEKIPHLELANTDELKNLFANRGAVISRGGYSSIMDAQVLGIPWLLIPTPGQTEQEYLYDWNRHQSEFHFLHENEINAEFLKQWWESIKVSETHKTSTEKDDLNQAIEDVIRQAGLQDFPENL